MLNILGVPNPDGSCCVVAMLNATVRPSYAWLVLKYCERTGLLIPWWRNLGSFLIFSNNSYHNSLQFMFAEGYPDVFWMSWYNLKHIYSVWYIFLRDINNLIQSIFVVFFFFVTKKSEPVAPVSLCLLLVLRLSLTHFACLRFDVPGSLCCRFTVPSASFLRWLCFYQEKLNKLHCNKLCFSPKTWIFVLVVFLLKDIKKAESKTGETKFIV